MWSADQNLGTGIGHWHPHMMIFAPYYDNSMLGNNEFGSLFPQLSDGSGTPFAVVVITVDNGWPSRCARERQPQKESRGLSGRIPFRCSPLPVAPHRHVLLLAKEIGREFPVASQSRSPNNSESCRVMISDQSPN